MAIDIDLITKSYKGDIPEGFVKQVLDRGIAVNYIDKKLKVYILSTIEDCSIFEVMNQVWENWPEQDWKDAETLWRGTYNSMIGEYKKNLKTGISSKI